MSAKNDIHALVENWIENSFRPLSIDSSSDEPMAPTVGGFRKLREELEYLDRIKFARYVPTLYSKHPISFFERLRSWLQNEGLTESDKRHLFEFATHLAFFSFDDFVAMFRSAFSGPISRWTMVKAGIRLNQSNWKERLDTERFEKTWYCPITDSLLISVFHHTNAISGKDRKPAFRELKHFSDADKIKEYMAAKKMDRIVLLEDCVGTGDQTFNTVKWAVEKLGVPILLCPMIIAREAVQRFLKFKSSISDPQSFDIAPVFELDQDCFLYRKNGQTRELFKLVRALAERIHINLTRDGEEPKEGALGYWKEESPEKGSIVVLFSNTPNNTVSLVHHDDSRRWKPLFPRVTRSPL